MNEWTKCIRIADCPFKREIDLRCNSQSGEKKNHYVLILKPLVQWKHFNDLFGFLWLLTHTPKSPPIAHNFLLCSHNPKTSLYETGNQWIPFGTVHSQRMWVILTAQDFLHHADGDSVTPPHASSFNLNRHFLEFQTETPANVKKRTKNKSTSIVLTPSLEVST